MSLSAGLIYGAFLFFILWFLIVCFIKMFSLDSKTIIPNSIFMTTPVVVTGLICLVLYLIFTFNIISTGTS